MDGLRFEWDPAKDALNQAKHAVSFDEARTVFFDPHALVIDDPDHSVTEQRFIIMGHSRTLRLLVVAHCYRTVDEVIRIISARKATKREAAHYREKNDMTDDMKSEYDFGDARPNPYSQRLKKQVTIRLDVDTVDYFKALARQTGIPYQSLINLYLADCADNERELSLKWA